jgi:2-methylcitrate dehydratase PrpD
VARRRELWLDPLGCQLIGVVLGADDIEEIRVGISETSLSHSGAIYEPHDTAGAQFSLPISLAIRLSKNDNDLSFYMDSKLWTDPKVLAPAKKVQSYADPNAKKDQNYNRTMEVKLTDGKSFKAFEAYPPARGSIWSAATC